MTDEFDPGRGDDVDLDLAVGASEDPSRSADPDAGGAVVVTTPSVIAHGAHRLPANPLSASREPSLTLARLHLRLGSLSLARAELETLAGRDALDDAGLVDLLEARWRTGDLTGAGAIATLLLGDGEDGPLLALVVASEAAAARGRPTEARRYATAAQAVAGDSIDTVFAGMPRGSVWPADAMALDLPGPTLFDEPQRGAAARPARRATAGVAAGTALASPSIDDGLVAEAHAGPGEPATIALWSADDLPGDGPGSETVTPAVAADSEPVLPVADEALAAGRDALVVGDVATAADQLGLALRFDPTLAPAILDAIGARTDRALAFVRGDAYRLLGREREARQAYADALRADPTGPDDVHPDPDPPRHPPEGDPA